MSTGPETLKQSRGRIGIIAGSGPEAGADILNKALNENRKQLGDEFRGDLEAPNVTLYSVPELGLSMDLEKNEELVWGYLKTSLNDVAARTDLFCIACDSLHYFSDRIIRLSLPSEFVSIIDSVTHYIKRNQIREVAILGSHSVMTLGKWSPYAALEHLAKLERPRNLVAETHELIFQIKRVGREPSAIKKHLEAIIAGLKSDTVLLACTELSMIEVEVPGKRVIDTNSLLAENIVRRSLSMRKSI